MFKNVYNGKKIIVTGHTGFKGSWLVTWLKMLGADVYGVSDKILKDTSHFNEIQKDLDLTKSYWGDISDPEFFSKIHEDVNPDFLFNLAAQAIVGKSYEDPFTTWKTNTLGTVNILNVLRNSSKTCICVMITSDKCYENMEWIWGYRENDILGGIDPYSSSKGAAELAISSFQRSFFKNKNKNIKVSSARAGNVLGGGDWSEGRIIPDLIKAWNSDVVLEVRNSRSTRPWQHVLEPLSGYLTLGQKMYEDKNVIGESFNFGPELQKDISVSELIHEMKNFFPDFHYNIIETYDEKFYESGLLRLNCDKALNLLSWRPALNFSETINFTANWYKNFYAKNNNVINITKDQILNYVDKAFSKQITWAMK